MAAEPLKDIERRALETWHLKWGGERLRSLAEQFWKLHRETAQTDRDAERQWYVLLCEPLREQTAAAHLIGRGFKVYLPMRMAHRSYGKRTAFGVKRRTRPVQVPMFPGYLPIRLDFDIDDRRRRFIDVAPGIRPGVHKFVRMNGRPCVLPESAMRIVQMVEEQSIRPQLPVSTFTIGQEVQVTEGPFASFPAIVSEIIKLDPVERISVLVNIFGRPTPVELSGDQVVAL